MRRRQNWLWILVVAGFIALRPVGDWSARTRLEYGLTAATPITRIVDFDPTAVTGIVAGAILGGFRGPAATLLWIKVSEMWHSGKGTQAESLNVMRTVTLLDPHWLQPWRITAWHMAYNLWVETDDPERRAWLKKQAIACLKEGISWNPDKYDLYWELGWTYFDKFNEYDNAVQWLTICTRMEHPDYIDRLIAHAYERKPEIQKALDWYEYCLKRDPTDHVAIGATITIRERYLPAWREMERGHYTEAIRLIDQFLQADPGDTIGMHVRGEIYERAGDLRKALKAWEDANSRSSVDKRAAFKVIELRKKLGLPYADVKPEGISREDQGFQPLGPPTGRGRMVR